MTLPRTVFPDLSGPCLPQSLSRRPLGEVGNGPGRTPDRPGVHGDSLAHPVRPCCGDGNPPPAGKRQRRWLLCARMMALSFAKHELGSLCHGVYEYEVYEPTETPALWRHQAATRRRLVETSCTWSLKRESAESLALRKGSFLPRDRTRNHSSRVLGKTTPSLVESGVVLLDDGGGRGTRTRRVCSSCQLHAQDESFMYVGVGGGVVIGDGLTEGCTAPSHLTSVQRDCRTTEKCVTVWCRHEASQAGSAASSRCWTEPEHAASQPVRRQSCIAQPLDPETTGLQGAITKSTQYVRPRAALVHALSSVGGVASTTSFVQCERVSMLPLVQAAVHGTDAWTPGHLDAPGVPAPETLPLDIVSQWTP